MPDPLSDHAHVIDALRLAAAEAESYLATIDTDPVRPRSDPNLPHASLPRGGVGSLQALNPVTKWKKRGPDERVAPPIG